MDEVKTTVSRPVDPVTVTVIAQADASRLPSGTKAVTPGAHQPDIIVSVVQPLIALLIRFTYAYLTTLVGLVMAGMTSDIIPATDFVHLVVKCAQLSLAGAGLGAMKDLVTIFGKLEQKYPLATGSV